MRLICSFSQDRQAQEFYYFLQSKNIAADLEIQAEGKEGGYAYNIWVVDEDHVEKATEYYQAFQDNPADPRFRGNLEKAMASPEEKEELSTRVIKPNWRPKARSTGPLTMGLLVLCMIVYTLINLSDTTRIEGEGGRVVTSTPELMKAMLFDVSHRDELEEELLKDYQFHRHLSPGSLPPEGQDLLKRFMQEREWRGLYRELIVRYQRPELPWNPFNRPMFEKIRQGEIWRLFTPCIAHHEMLHILFNMLWLLLLGPQMERLLGIPRYLLAILIIGAISNTAQYLMGGPNFLGYSGIVCGMLGFIWMRQKRAPWEGYALQPGTFVMVSIFVFGLAGLQLYAFLRELSALAPFFPGIANTAHIMGGLSGIVLGRIPWFAAKG